MDTRPPSEYCSYGNAGILSPGSCVPLATPGVQWKVPGYLADPMGPLTIRWGYLPRAAPWLLRLPGRQVGYSNACQFLLGIVVLLGIPAQRAVSFSFHNTAIARLSVLPNGAGGSQVRLISLGDDRHLERMKDEG